MHARGVATSANLHDDSGVASFEASYKEMAKVRRLSPLLFMCVVGLVNGLLPPVPHLAVCMLSQLLS